MRVSRPRRCTSNERGLTLIEVLVVVALAALLMVGAVSGTGALAGTRVKSAASMIAGGVRLAYARASAVARPQRLVFDLDGGRVLLEEADAPFLVASGAPAGGADPATAAEREAVEAAEKITKGPKAPRARFKPVKALGFDEGEAKGSRSVGNGVKIRRVETSHAPDGETEGRAYLYFWPGGRTERAAIQLQVASESQSDSGLTVVVAPLTGKATILGGLAHMPTFRDDSEREDRGY